MNQKPIEVARSPFVQGSFAALLRAAQRAREIAARTGTLLVVSRNGVIEYADPRTGQVIGTPVRESALGVDRGEAS